MQKKVIFTIIILLIVCALLAVGVTFAYYRFGESGWSQTISATSVVFKLNGKPVETVTSYDLGLVSRGKEADLDFEVSIKASASQGSAASFFLSISFDENNADANELARAVEVYAYQNGAYEYIGMLDNMDGISGTLMVNTEQNFYYKFVYSPSASDYYDGKSFSLILSASSSVNSGENDYYFVSSYAGLMRAASAGAALSGKTLVLTNNVTLSSDLENDGVVNFNYPVSLDINGKTLSLGQGTSINFTYDTASRPSVINSNPSHGSIVGEGRVVYNCPTAAAQGDVVSIQDSLSDSYSRITVNNASFTAAAQLMQEKLHKFSDRVIMVGDTVDFTQNLKYYFSEVYGAARVYSIVPPRIGGVDDESIIEKLDNTYTAYRVNPLYNEELTLTQHLNFALYTAAGSSATLKAHLTVRGTAMSAVAASLLAGIPDTVSGSLYLAGRDAVSNSTVTWITTGNLLNSNGVFLPEGYADLDSWQDETMRIGVIVYCAGVSYSDYKTVTIRKLTAKQRTDLVYNYQQIIVEQLDTVKDFYGSYVDSSLAQKTGLSDINLSIANAAQNRNSIGQDYLEIIQGANVGDAIKVANKPNVGSSVLIDVNIEFVYSDYNTAGEVVTTSYTLRKTVVLVGYTASTELSDPTPMLQQDFDANAYVSGSGYSFTAQGYTARGANVDYFVAAPYNEYVFVQNGVYTATVSGHFALINGEYVFFDATYDYDAVNSAYVSAISGDFIEVDGVYLNISAQKAANQIYERDSVITILPSKVPAVLETVVSVTAKLWDTMENGVPDYHVDASSAELVYYLHLTVNGIYHNTAAEIEAFSIYNTLMRYYDLNGNGWIEVSEAQTEWFTDGVQNLAAALSSQTIFSGANAKTFYYVDFSDNDISSTKGLEYFINALGFDLSGNSIIDIGNLNALYNLQYVDLAENLVSDITDLEYLDSLEVIVLSENPLTSIKPIRYLPSVSYLDLRNCENITSFEYLQNYDSLRFVDIRQADRRASTSDETAYYLSLVYDNNRDNDIVIYRDLSSTWTPDDTEVVASKVLNEMVAINEVYTTLNLPNYYYYEYTVNGTVYRKTYNVAWTTSLADEAFLSFTTTNGKTTGYTINTPIVNRTITVRVTVTDVATSQGVSVERPFVLTLLQSQAADDIAYIETAANVYELASDVVPDTNLLNVLFGIFNTTRTGTILYGGNTYYEKSTITQAELSRQDTNNHDDVFKGAGITSLVGLRHFANGVHFDLDLTNNILEPSSIGELSYMTNVKVIKLNGGDYDYSLISSYTDGEPTPTISGLTGLEALYVYGCLNLDGDTALNRLYQVYLANPLVEIFKDGTSSTSQWDPYGILHKYTSDLPSAFVFINLNDTESYYEVGQNHHVYNFYGVKDIDFSLSTSDSNLSGFFAGNFIHNANGVVYRTLAGYTDTVYDKTSLTGNDGSGRGDITADHYIELRAEFNYRILVTDYPLADGNVGLDTIFPGRDLRSEVIGALSALFESGSGEGYTVNGNYYYITMATIAALPLTDISVDGTFSDSGENVVQGLQYTSITELKFDRDTNLGDGTYLYNIEKLVIAFSGIDFSNISIDLPNLEKIYMGLVGGVVGGTIETNRYALLYNNSEATPVYNLAHFTGLKEFVLIESNCFNWQGLTGLIGKDISKLYIYATKGKNTTFSNGNATASSTEAIVRQIYTGSNAASKDFRIGTLADESSTDSYTGAGWVTSASGGLTSITQDAVKEYGDFVPLISDLGVKLDGTLAATLSEMIITDGKTITLPSSTYGTYYGTNNGDSNDFNRRFAIQWKIIGVSTADATQLFGINVTATAVTAEELGLSGKTTGLTYCYVPNTSSGFSDIQLTVDSYAYDYYLVISGTLGGPYIDSEGVSYANGGYFNDEGGFVQFATAVTPQTFAYPILIYGTSALSSKTVSISYSATQNGSSAGTVSVTGDYFYQKTVNGKTATYLSYRAIKDPMMRFRLFTGIATLSFLSAGQGYDLNGIMFYHADGYIGVPKITSISGTPTSGTLMFEGSAATDTAGTAIDFSAFGKNVSKSYSLNLDGLEYFLGLSSLDLSGNDLRDISALTDLATYDGKHLFYNGTDTVRSGLTAVNLSNNLISDVSCFEECKSLISVNLSGNPLITISDGGFVFASSVATLTTLNLASCKELAAADFTALAAAYSTYKTAHGAAVLSTLNLNDTQAVYAPATLTALAVVADSVSGSLNVSYATAETSVFTKSEIEDFFGDIGYNDVSNYAYTYINSGYPIASTFASDLSITRNASSTNYTLSLLAADNLLNDNVGLSSYLGTMGTLTTPLMITRVGTQYAAKYDITLYDTNNSSATVSTSAPIAIYNKTQEYHYSDEFDDGLWLYLIKHSTLKSNGSVSYFDYSPVDGEGKRVTSMRISPTDIGLKSLKGINLLTAVTSLTIGSATTSNNAITGLWDGSFNSLTSLTVINTAITEESLSALRYAPNLVTLDLSLTERIDYKRSFSYTFNSVSYTSTAADIILDYCKSLKKIRINAVKSANMYAGATAYQSYISSSAASGYLFGILPASNSNAKRHSAFNVTDGGLSVFTSSIIANGITIRHSLRDFDASGTATANALFLAAQSLVTENDSAIVTSESIAAGYAALINTANGRDVLPNQINQLDVESTGIIYYLPEFLNVNGVTLTFEWSMSIGNADYIQDNVFNLTTANFNLEDLPADNIIAISYALKNGNTTVYSGTKNITVVPSSVPEVSGSSKLPTYYLEVPGDNGKMVLRPAGDYFISSRFQFWLFNNKFASSLSTVTFSNYQSLGVAATAIGALYLPNSVMLSTDSMVIPSEGITTLAGIELFVNLREFSIAGGAIVSIDELSNMHLTSFAYSNSSSAGRNFLIQDFTPLLNSKDTLTSFSYHTGGYVVNIDDLGFLKEFGSQLTTITIGTDKNYIEGYNHTASFEYLKYWFAANRPLTTITYNTVVATATDDDWQKATSLFDEIDFTGSGLTEISVARLGFSANAVSNASGITATVPTYINLGGNYYPLKWNSMSAFVNVSDLIYSGSAFSFTFDGAESATAITNGMALTAAQYAELLEDRTFVQSLISNSVSVGQTITLIDKASNLSSFAYLLTRIEFDGYSFEKSFILDFNDNLVYRQILVPSASGHLFLPTLYQGSECSWFLADGQGAAILPQIGIASYNGVTIASLDFVNGDNNNVNRYFLVITAPTAAVSGGINLICRVGSTDISYVLYHSYTAAAQNAAFNSAHPTANQRDYVILYNAVSFDRIKANYVSQLDALLASCTEAYNSNDYSAANYAVIVGLYNDAVDDIETAAELANAYSTFNQACADINAVAHQYSVYHNMLSNGTGDEFDTMTYATAGDSVTLPSQGDYTFTSEDGNAIIAWMVNGVRYEFGTQFTMPAESVVIAPVFTVNYDYYFVPAGSESSYATLGYLMQETIHTTNSVTYDYVIDHVVLSDADLRNTLEYSIVRTISNSHNNDYTLVGSYTIESTLKTLTTRSGATENKTIHSAMGIYTFYFDADKTNPNNYIIAERGTYLFTLSGTYGVALRTSDATAGYATNANWKKPDLNFVMEYSRELGVYYATFTSGTAMASNGIKVCGYNVSRIGIASSAIGTDFMLSDGNGTTTNITSGLSNNTLYTVYFTDLASVFNKPNVANYGGNAVGFTCSTGNVVKYATPGIVICAGTYEDTKSLITCDFNAAP